MNNMETFLTVVKELKQNVIQQNKFTENGYFNKYLSNISVIFKELLLFTIAFKIKVKK